MPTHQTHHPSHRTTQRSALNRRQFVKAASTGLAVAPFIGLYGCAWQRTIQRGSELVRKRNQPLDLAPGLSYIELDRNGNTLGDGFTSPGRPDGMGCFVADDGSLILMRNHEITLKHHGTSDGRGAYLPDNIPRQAYTATDLGGVSRLLLDPQSLSVIQSNMVLTGTRNNCAGGISPYGWLSCEETLDDDDNQIHGFVFLCDVNAQELSPPIRVDAYGRFVHEAAGFDLRTGRCYLTEDISTGCLYRFQPADRSRPFDGKLQALSVIGEKTFKTTTMTTGESKLIEWIDVPDALAGENVSRDSQSLGAAVFVRGEGCWYDNDQLVFCCTEGGPNSKGQIFKLVDSDDGATLTLLAQSDAKTDISHPDNITISPTGDIFFAEDTFGECLIQHVSKEGIVTAVARNTEQGQEIAGLCFSPDGRVLFGNIQEPGITFAIHGF